MDWMKELNEVKPNNPEQYELIDRTKEFLKASANDLDDFRYLDYYKKLIENFEDKDFAMIILKIVYKAIDFKTIDTVLQGFEIYKEQDICKEVKEAYNMTIKFIKALESRPEMFNKYVSAYVDRMELISENAKKGLIGTSFDRMHISNILTQVTYVIDLFS